MKKYRKEFAFDLKVDELKTSCPWLKNCLTKMDVTDVGKIHEVTDFIKCDIENEGEHR